MGLGVAWEDYLVGDGRGMEELMGGFDCGLGGVMSSVGGDLDSALGVGGIPPWKLYWLDVVTIVRYERK